MIMVKLNKLIDTLWLTEEEITKLKAEGYTEFEENGKTPKKPV